MYLYLKAIYISLVSNYNKYKNTKPEILLYKWKKSKMKNAQTNRNTIKSVLCWPSTTGHGAHLQV